MPKKKSMCQPGNAGSTKKHNQGEKIYQKENKKQH